MECLEKLIGFGGDCNYDNQLAIDDLPLITLENAACVTEENRGSDLINKLIKIAAREVPNEFFGRFKDFKFNSVVDRFLMTDYSDQLTDPEMGMATVVIEKTNNDPFITLKLGAFRLKAESGEVREVTITSETGKEWKEKVKVDGGNHYINIKGDKITIKYNAAHLQLYKNYSEVNSCDKRCSCDGCFEIYSLDDCDGRSNNFNGLWLDVCCVCDKEKFLCHYADLFGLAMLYKTGILFYREILNTTRLSDAQEGLEQRAQGNIDYYEGFYDITTSKYVKGKYWSALDDIRNQISEHFKHIKTDCLTCTGAKIVNIIS